MNGYKVPSQSLYVLRAKAHSFNILIEANYILRFGRLSEYRQRVVSEYQCLEAEDILYWRALYIESTIYSVE